MRRRTALTTATTALLATALLLPATAAAADTTTAAGDSTSAPAADVAAAITGLWADQTDHGYVLRATATGDVDHVTFVLQQAYAIGGAGPDIDITVSQPSVDGSWQTTGPLHLPHADYYISAYAYAPDGTRSNETFIGGQATPIKPLPVFHNTVFSAGPLNYDHPTETVTGSFTTYDPDAGDTGAPWTGPLTVQASAGNTQNTANIATTQTVAADGSWSISFRPTPNTSGDLPVSVQAILPGVSCPGCVSDAVAGPGTTVPVQYNQPTRLLLDHSSVTLTAGTKTTVSGILQYQNATGWHPVPQAFVFLGGDGTWSATQSYTDAAGRFTFTMTVPNTTTTWPIYIYTPSGSTSRYLASTKTGFTVTATPARPVLQLSGAAIDANSNLTFHQSVTSPTGTPGGTVQLQQSADGRTGWTTIATLPAATATHTLHVTNPHGYWRLLTPTAPGYAQAVSDTIHTFRYQMRITGGPSTTSVHPGTWVHFTGALTQQGYGAATPCTGATVQLLFRPTGSAHTSLIGTAHTDSHGNFGLWAKPTTSGTWTLAYQTPSVWNTNASTTTTIHVS